jgi:hypothetical protein
VFRRPANVIAMQNACCPHAACAHEVHRDDASNIFFSPSIIENPYRLFLNRAHNASRCRARTRCSTAFDKNLVAMAAIVIRAMCVHACAISQFDNDIRRKRVRTPRIRARSKRSCVWMTQML